MVKVKPTASQGRITVRSNNDTTIFGIKDNLSEYYAKLAERWANSPDMVNGIDYSSKYYAEQSKASAQVASDIKSETQVLVDGFDNNVQIAKDDIEQNRINSINAIDSTYSVAVGDMQEKSDEVLASIEASKDEAIDSINSTKTTILNDIEFIADGEKKEIEYLADEIKDSGNTVNTTIEAGVKRLNSIDSLKNNQITNCLREVPQRIKYTLDNGTLTVHAGSVCIVPYGTEDRTSEFPIGSRFLNDNFKVYDTQFADGKFFVWAELVNNVISSEKTTDSSKRFAYFDMNDGGVWSITNSESGTSDIASKTYTLYYNTTLNSVGSATSSTTINYGYGRSLPIFINYSDGSHIFASINQVFNGFGYIGSTIWVDKGVKGLSPNDRNEDGTLRNIEWTTQNILLRNNTESGSYYLAILDGGTRASIAGKSNWYFDEKSNRILGDGIIKYNIGFYGDITLATGGVITSFNPKHPLKVADIQDVVRKTGDTMTGALVFDQDSDMEPIKIATDNVLGSAGETLQDIAYYNAGLRIAKIRGTYNPSAHQTSLLAILYDNETGTSKGAVSLAYNPTNGTTFEFPRCTTKATTTSSASNGKVAVVVTNYKNGTSWYRVWSDGWIEQGGAISMPEFTTSTSKAVTLLKKFSDTNYTVLSQLINGGSNWALVQGCNITSKQTGQFALNLYTSGGTGTIASQSRQWYACGY